MAIATVFVINELFSKKPHQNIISYLTKKMKADRMKVVKIWNYGISESDKEQTIYRKRSTKPSFYIMGLVGG